MKRFLIAAEFHTSSKTAKSTRDTVSRIVSSLGEAYRAQESLWFLYSDCTKDEISKRVRSVMDNRDQLIVTNVGGVYYAGWDKDFNKYLAQHVNQHS